MFFICISLMGFPHFMWFFYHPLWWNDFLIGFYFLTVEFWEFWIMCFGYKIFAGYVIGKYLLVVCDLSFHLLSGSFTEQSFFKFQWSPSLLIILWLMQLGWQSFSFSTLKIVYFCLNFMVSDEKSTVVESLFPYKLWELYVPI